MTIKETLQNINDLYAAVVEVNEQLQETIKQQKITGIQLDTRERRLKDREQNIATLEERLSNEAISKILHEVEYELRDDRTRIKNEARELQLKKDNFDEYVAKINRDKQAQFDQKEKELNDLEARLSIKVDWEQKIKETYDKMQEIFKFSKTPNITYEQKRDIKLEALKIISKGI